VRRIEKRSDTCIVIGKRERGRSEECFNRITGRRGRGCALRWTACVKGMCA